MKKFTHSTGTSHCKFLSHLCWGLVFTSAQHGAHCGNSYFQSLLYLYHLRCLDGGPSLADETINPIGWSFKCIKSWVSTLVYLAKVLTLSNLIFFLILFKIYFFISFTPIPLFMDYRGDGTSTQHHVILPSLAHHDFWNVTFGHYLFNEGIHTWYLVSLVPC